MADAQTEVDLELLHTVMRDTIAAAFPSLQTVEFYREDREELTIPACLLEMEEMEPGDIDPGTDQACMSVRFCAYFVVGFRTPQSKLEVRKLAGAFLAFLRQQLRWPGVVTGPVQIVGAWPDSFHPHLDQYEVYKVEWNHLMHFGTSVWDGDGFVPETILFAYSPDIGIPHKDEYEEL